MGSQLSVLNWHQTFYQKLQMRNVDRVYDLTVVHPGVKHKLHTLIHFRLRAHCNDNKSMRDAASEMYYSEMDDGLNTSWSTLKDQCRCVIKIA